MSERRDIEDLRLSEQGANLISEREGCILTAYLDSRGTLTIGIGHTSAAGPPKVVQGMTITQNKAMQIFRDDNARFRRQCLPLVRSPLHQHEFDALASFVFNLGATQFRGSTALKRLNQGDYAGCAEAMLFWNKPPEVMSRRRGEHDQFLNLQHVARA